MNLMSCILLLSGYQRDICGLGFSWLAVRQQPGVAELLPLALPFPIHVDQGLVDAFGNPFLTCSGFVAVFIDEGDILDYPIVSHYIPRSKPFPSTWEYMKNPGGWRRVDSYWLRSCGQRLLSCLIG